jgi:hypothetical protein
MVVETLGDAFAAGWRTTARCAWGKREGMKTRRECHYTRELDLETLVRTRGPNFPLSSLDGRLMCPRCRSRRVIVMFQPPTASRSASGWTGITRLVAEGDGEDQEQHDGWPEQHVDAHADKQTRNEATYVVVGVLRRGGWRAVGPPVANGAACAPSERGRPW